jgi:DNA-binding CsgD family transcriptional regulator
VFWDLHEKESLTSDMLNKLGLHEGICIFRRKINYVDVFYIGSRKETGTNIYDLYLNNPQSIFRLISFFEEAVLPKMPMSNKDFFLPYMDGCRLRLPNMQEKNPGEELQDFYDATRLKKFSLQKGQEKISLSLRELQCLHFLAKGYTSKDIANALGISFRTVEHYLLHMRYKVDCTNKLQLIEFYQENDVATWFNK